VDHRQPLREKKKNETLTYEYLNRLSNFAVVHVSCHRIKSATEGSAKVPLVNEKHVEYETLISDAIVSSAKKDGVSRRAIKKYVLAHHAKTVDPVDFDSSFRTVLKSGVEKRIFI
jgi:hypothetical protein